MSRKNKRRTIDFDEMKYSPELIRQLSDPEYIKKADEYERKVKSRFHKRETGHSSVTTDYRPPSRKTSDNKKRKTRWRPGKLIRNILILLVLLLLIVIAIIFSLTGKFEKIDTSNSDFAIDRQVASDLSGYRNIAILGVDARADEGYDGARSDAIIILSIKKITGEIHLISVMRDSYLKMGYLDGSLVLDKITHAHHYAGGVNTCAALNRSLDLNIDEFIIFNWKSVSDMVNSLDGVEVDVKEDEIADMNHYGYETANNVGGSYTQITTAGPQVLDGAQAVTYCRIRKTSGGDSSRGNRYKTVVSAVIKKAATHPWKVSSMANQVFPQIRTNMSQIDFTTLSLELIRMDMGESISWPEDYYAGALASGISYVVPRTLESNVKKLHKEAFGQENYTLSDVASQINSDIIFDTGIQ